MTHQFQAAAANVHGDGAVAGRANGNGDSALHSRGIAPAHVSGPTHVNGSAPGRQFPVWPGEPVALPVGDVFVRKATASPEAEPAVFVHGLAGSALDCADLTGLGAEAHGD